MAEYRCTVKGFDSGLNELLNNQKTRWDRRTKRMIVSNSEKAKNDRVCLKAIWRDLHDVRIDKPIKVFYKIYAKDKRHDRPNIGYAFCKSFLDALQMGKIIKNDGWDDVLGTYFAYEIDKENPRVEVIIQTQESEDVK